MEPKCIESIKNWPEPQSIREIQAFIGFANFYRRFIRNFSAIAGPLTSMLKTGPRPKTFKSTKRNIVNITQNNPALFLTKRSQKVISEIKKGFL